MFEAKVHAFSLLIYRLEPTQTVGKGTRPGRQGRGFREAEGALFHLGRRHRTCLRVAPLLVLIWTCFVLKRSATWHALSRRPMRNFGGGLNSIAP